MENLLPGPAPRSPNNPPHPQKLALKQLGELLLESFRYHKSRLAIGFLALIIVDFLQLIIPRIIKHGVDGLAAGTINLNGLLQLGIMIIFIAGWVVLLRFCWRYLIIGFSRILEQNVRNRIFAHILKMDAIFFEKHTTGDLMAHSSNDLSAVQMACGMGMVAAVDALVMSVAAIGFMLAINPLLTLCALMPMPFLAIATRILSSRLHKRFAKVQEQFSAMTEFTRSTLVSIGLIKAYTMENLQTNRFDAIGSQYVRSNLQVATIQGLISPLATLVGSAGMLMVLLVGGRLAINGTITLGDFVAFITYLYMLIWPMMAIGWVANLVQRGITSLSRIYALVTSRSALPDDTANDPPHHLPSPGFSLHNLTFSYPQGSSPALQNIHLDLGPGIHGFTGKTGAGKSTICKLLLRLYPVGEGQLMFAGLEVNSLSVEYVRKHISYVSQEPVLFSDTISANIAYGAPQASQQVIIAAAQAAAVHNDILQLSEGYETRIGERGVKLSGGQKQRLALARALLCDRPVLIVDDGLSAVDVATEHEVFNGLRNHFAGKTIIIVSNRIKLLSMTDRIYILENGRVSNQGNHTELLARDALYQTMFEKQMQQLNGENEG